MKVGVIGVGGIARSKHLPGWMACPGVAIAAVADRDADLLRCVAEQHNVPHAYTDWRDLIRQDDLDVVDVVTPNCWHAPMTIAALEAGKHVLCEKPMATTYADACRMLEASYRANRLLMINHHFRFHAGVLGLRQLAEEHPLGRIYHAIARWTRRRGVPPRETFIRRELSGGGPVLDLGVHVLDLALSLMGDPTPATVSASVGTPLAHQRGLGGMWGDWDADAFDVEDFGVGLFRFADGATLAFEASWLGFQSELDTYSVRLFGTEGGLHWPDGVLVTERAKTPVDIKLMTADDGQPYLQTIRAFADAIRLGKPAPIPPESSARVIQLVEAFYRSAELGREVVIE